MSKLPVALVSASLAAALGLAPVAQAAEKDPKPTAVFLGGTGTGYVPTGPTPPAAFITPFVSGPYKGVNHVYDGLPTTTPQSQVPGLVAVIASEQAQGNRVTVIGLSKGAQVAQASMFGPNAPAPGSVDYVLIGNPDRDGGANTAMGWRPPQGEVRFNRNDVFGEYDGFAEAPDRPNPLALANAAMGIVYVHFAYGTGGANDPLTHLDKAEVTVKDNLGADGKPNGTTSTTTRIPTKDLPLTRPIRDTLKTWHLGTDGLDQFDAAVRPVIDSGYSRNDKPKAPATTAPATEKNDSTTPAPVAAKTTPKPQKKAQNPQKKAQNPLANLFRPPVKATPKPKAAPAAKATTTKKESNDNG